MEQNVKPLTDINGLMRKYSTPVPWRFRKIGDALMVGALGLSGLITGLPLTDHQKVWIMFCVNVLGVLGKVITNFAGDDSDKELAL